MVPTEPSTDPAPRDTVCPTCTGIAVFREHTKIGKPGSYSEIICKDCSGTGFVTASQAKEILARLSQPPPKKS